MRQVLGVVIALFFCVHAKAACTPAGMVKIVMVDVTPGVDPKSFEGQPRVIYRSGGKYGRSEEPLDAANKILGRIVANEPDIWMYNDVAKQGQHVVDDPPHMFKMPIHWSEELPSELIELEIGCEVQFMKDKGATAPKEDAGPACSRSMLKLGRTRVVLDVESATGNPAALEFRQGKKVTQRFEYRKYETGLPLDPTLFTRPEGVTFSEVQK